MPKRHPLRSHQEQALARLLGSCRSVWNDALKLRTERFTAESAQVDPAYVARIANACEAFGVEF